MSRELGKVGALTLRAAIDAKGYPHAHSIRAVIPHGVSDLSLALTTAQMKRINDGAILIDADLRAPLSEEVDELGLERVYFDIDVVESIELPVVGPGQILTHIRQVDFPERFFLSPARQTFRDGYRNIHCRFSLLYTSNTAIRQSNVVHYFLI